MMGNKFWLDCVKLCVSLSVCCQYWLVVIIVIVIGIVGCKIIKAKKKSNAKTSPEDTSSEDTSSEDTASEDTAPEKTAPLKMPCQLLLWISWFLGILAVILFVNATVTLSEATHFVVESPLTYSDVILMLIGLAGDILIAVVTFRVQRKIEEQKAKEDREREKREKQIEQERQKREKRIEREHQERLAQQQHHLWMAEHFGSIQSSFQTICKGTNLNINKEEKKDYENGKLLIRIENHSDNGTYLFYPQYFSVKPRLTLAENVSPEFKEKSEANQDDNNAFCLDSNKLEIVFGVNHDNQDVLRKVQNALLYPCSTIPYPQQSSLKPQSFRFRLDITAEDRSYLINEDKKAMVYGINYTICFTLTQKSTYGYDDRGTFELVMSDYSISAEPPKPVEKGEFVAA